MTEAITVTVKQDNTRGTRNTTRDICVNGVRVGCVTRQSYGRFGYGAWELRLTGFPDGDRRPPGVTEEFVTLADAKSYTAQSIADRSDR